MIKSDFILPLTSVYEMVETTNGRWIVTHGANFQDYLQIVDTETSLGTTIPIESAPALTQNRVVYVKTSETPGYFKFITLEYTPASNTWVQSEAELAYDGVGITNTIYLGNQVYVAIRGNYLYSYDAATSVALPEVSILDSPNFSRLLRTSDTSFLALKEGAKPVFMDISGFRQELNTQITEDHILSYTVHDYGVVPHTLGFILYTLNNTYDITLEFYEVGGSPNPLASLPLASYFEFTIGALQKPVRLVDGTYAFPIYVHSTETIGLIKIPPDFNPAQPVYNLQQTPIGLPANLAHSHSFTFADSNEIVYMGFHSYEVINIL